jgi:hypothetical protein
MTLPVNTGPGIVPRKQDIIYIFLNEIQIDTVDKTNNS